MDGFTSYEGNAVRWTVYHNEGTTFVYAFTETIALMRFMAKYPHRTVRTIQRYYPPNSKTHHRAAAVVSFFVILSLRPPTLSG